MLGAVVSIEINCSLITKLFMLKFFAHRGYLPQKNSQNLLPQNSIASLKNAVDHGFTAIEFDIWLIENQLILSHDLPNDIRDCAGFSDYLQYQNQLEYWLDFKNLSLENIDTILKILALDLAKKNINLAQLYFAPYCVNYSLTKIFYEKFKKYFNDQINFVAVCDNSSQIADLEQLILDHQIKFISIDHKLITKELVEKFKKCHLMAWTIKDYDTLIQLHNLSVEYFACDILPKKN